MVRIRRTTVEDLSRIETLLCKSYPATMVAAYDAAVLAAALPFITKAQLDLLTSGTFYVAEEAGRILGCGGWTFGAPGSGQISEGLAHIRHFAVDPERARAGFGRLIFEECARAAHQAGAVRFQVFSSLNAENFYARMGLQRLDIVAVPIREEVVFPAVLMEGPVTAAS